jgi:hypothetical protein
VDASISRCRCRELQESRAYYSLFEEFITIAWRMFVVVKVQFIMIQLYDLCFDV